VKSRAGRVLNLLVVCLLLAPLVLCEERSAPVKREERKVPNAEKKPAKQLSLEQKLSKRVTLSTDGDLLDNFIGRLAKQTDVNMVLDYGALENRPEVRLRRITLRNVPLKTALKVTLRTVGLDCKPYKQFVFISTPTRLRRYPLEKLETRFYELKGSATGTLPKVVLINPAAAGQGNFSSITQLMAPVNPALVGEAPVSGQRR
jgi:hypothetical protein